MKGFCLIYDCASQHLMMSSDVLLGAKHTSRHANETTTQTNGSPGSPHITQNQALRLFQRLNKHTLLFFIHCFSV